MDAIFKANPSVSSLNFLRHAHDCFLRHQVLRPEIFRERPRNRKRHVAFPRVPIERGDGIDCARGAGGLHFCERPGGPRLHRGARCGGSEIDRAAVRRVQQRGPHGGEGIRDPGGARSRLFAARGRGAHRRALARAEPEDPSRLQPCARSEFFAQWARRLRPPRQDRRHRRHRAHRQEHRGHFRRLRHTNPCIRSVSGDRLGGEMRVPTPPWSTYRCRTSPVRCRQRSTRPPGC